MAAPPPQSGSCHFRKSSAPATPRCFCASYKAASARQPPPCTFFVPLLSPSNHFPLCHVSYLAQRQSTTFYTSTTIFANTSQASHRRACPSPCLRDFGSITRGRITTALGCSETSAGYLTSPHPLATPGGIRPVCVPGPQDPSKFSK